MPRGAGPADYVCVTPASQQQVRNENAQGQLLKEPNGAYGPETCKPGYVWREAFSGDTVCVLPERRTQVRAENARAAETRQP